MEGKFGLKKNLNRHLKTVHSGKKRIKKVKNLVCQECDKVYSRPSSLKRHIKEIHQEHLRVIDIYCIHCKDLNFDTKGNSKTFFNFYHDKFTFFLC